MAARDVVMIAVVVFTFAIAFLAGHYALNQGLSRMINTTQINETPEAVAALQDAQDLTSRFDYIVFALFIGLGLALIITGWFIGGNPIFAAIYFLVIVIAVVLSAIFANVWETVTQTATFGSTLSSFPLTNNLLLLLPIYIAVVGFIGLVVMFAKPYIQQE